MGMFDGAEGIMKRQMVLFFIIDCSDSMAGTKITAVNTAVRGVLPELQDAGGSDVDLKVACLKFSTGCEWMYPTPIAAENFSWQELQADGRTDMGAAFEELEKVMHHDKFLKAPSVSVAPAIFLMSSSEPTDDYKSGLSKLQRNNWFKHAIKVALAIGDGANKDILAEFTGNMEAVVTAHNPEALKKWIRAVDLWDDYSDDYDIEEKEIAIQESLKKFDNLENKKIIFIVETSDFVKERIDVINYKVESLVNNLAKTEVAFLSFSDEVKWMHRKFFDAENFEFFPFKCSGQSNYEKMFCELSDMLIKASEKQILSDSELIICFITTKDISLSNETLTKLVGNKDFRHSQKFLVSILNDENLYNSDLLFALSNQCIDDTGSFIAKPKIISLEELSLESISDCNIYGDDW